MADAKGQRQNVHHIVAKGHAEANVVCVGLKNPDCKDSRNIWVGSKILLFCGFFDADFARNISC